MVWEVIDCVLPFSIVWFGGIHVNVYAGCNCILAVAILIIM